MELLDAQRHLLGGRHEQRAEPDRGRVVLLGGLDDRPDRDLLAEVDDRVAVVGEDRVDQRLADVVHVAEDGGERRRCPSCSPRACRGSCSSCATARFMTSALCSTKGRMSSPAPNLSPTSFMAGSSTSLRVGTAPIFSHRAVDPVLDAVLLAPQDVAVQRLLGLHVGGRVGDLGGGLLALGLEVGDEELERVLAAVEDEVVGQLALGLGDLAVRRDVVRVDHREVEPGLDAVVQEDRVEHRARRRRDAEGHVGDAERGLDAAAAPP